MIGVGYAALKVAQDSLVDLYNEIEEVAHHLTGDLIKRHDLHMTLMYDRRNPVPARNIPYFSKSGRVYKGTLTGVKMLGEPTSEYRAVALVIDCPAIVDRHDELSTTMTHSYDEFIPHISLAYGATPADYEILNEIVMKFIGVEVELYGESFATVKP